MLQKKSKIIALIITIAVIAFVIWFFSRPKPLEVTVSKAQTGKVESVVTNTRAGTITACRRARLAPVSGGQIAKLPVTEGQHVEAGQVLLEMWNEDLQAQQLLAKQEAVAAKARAKETCVRADVAKREAIRQEKLAKQKLASEEDVDRAAGNAEATRAACIAANDSAKVADAQVNVVQVALDKTILRAPFAGIIAEVNGEVGEFVTPSPVGIPTLPAVDLIDNTCIYVAAPIDEVDAPAIKPAMPARITLDAFKQHPFPGKVRRVAPYVQDIEKQARTVDIEVDFEHVVGEQSLMPGYSADVEILLDVKENTLRIPTEAVLERNYVYIVNRDSHILQKKKINTGISNWVYTEVLSGLTENDIIVTSATLEGLADGLEVRIKENNDSQ
ncbi:MAG: RND transporter [Gammaproteobacteria bacterium SG8_11]|nr:MAG: RND transporter [Gammaproteobacteria bacterium SG8_11]